VRHARRSAHAIPSRSSWPCSSSAAASRDLSRMTTAPVSLGSGRTGSPSGPMDQHAAR
jgi:hypothetical protein